MTDFAAAREAMVDSQVRTSDVTRYAIIEAMSWCPRELFVPRAYDEIAYAETEVPMAPGRAMMAPRAVAKMLDAVGIGPDDLVLDVAPGTGYSTAIISRLAAAVVAVEPDADLAARAATLFEELELVNTIVEQGDPAEGAPAHGPYEVIFVNGAVEELPTTLTGQLRNGGRLVAIFAERGVGRCKIMLRAGDSLAERVVFDLDAPRLPGFERPHAFTF